MEFSLDRSRAQLREPVHRLGRGRAALLLHKVPGGDPGRAGKLCGIHMNSAIIFSLVGIPLAFSHAGTGGDYACGNPHTAPSMKYGKFGERGLLGAIRPRKVFSSVPLGSLLRPRACAECQYDEEGMYNGYNSNGGNPAFQCYLSKRDPTLVLLHATWEAREFVNGSGPFFAARFLRVLIL